MGKSIIRNRILLSGFEIGDNNRGSAALGYGSIAFLRNKGFVNEGDEFWMVSVLDKWPWRNRNKKYTMRMILAGECVDVKMARCYRFEYSLYLKTKFSLPFTPLGKLVRRVKLTAATNGGDGFSDIYSDSVFLNRLTESWVAMKENVQVIILPQTLGPFRSEKMRSVANVILRYASKIYIRDNKFEEELCRMDLAYEKEKDLSAYMDPEPWDINVVDGAVGINISGLAYDNVFGTLKGQFNTYPKLITEIIKNFLNEGLKVYLIPHSYNYFNPEIGNDDMTATRKVYESLEDKSNVVFVDKNLLSPQIKYIISKMSFFVGTRMHANFAAIYTNVPVFGLAYSYKFAGAFEANGHSADHTYMINNMSESDIPKVIDKINTLYVETKK